MATPTEYTLPHFGLLDLFDPDNYYDVEIEFNGETVQLDLNFDSDDIEVERLDAVKAIIENLQQQDAKNREYIMADYEDIESDAVKFYLKFHLEEIGEEKLAGIVGADDPSLPIEDQLLRKLKLVRVGFYPDDEGYFAICDYSFGVDITNYMLVVTLNENGELLDMTVES